MNQIRNKIQAFNDGIISIVSFGDIDSNTRVTYRRNRIAAKLRSRTLQGETRAILKIASKSVRNVKQS